MTFTRAEREWWFSKTTSHVIAGEVDWKPINGSVRGKFPYIADGLTSVEPSVLFMIRARRLYEPTLMVELGGACLARVDINGFHVFEDGLRAATHLQIHDTGASTVPSTQELLNFPEIPPDYKIEFDQVMWLALDAAAPHLNLDFSGIDRRQPIPNRI